MDLISIPLVKRKTVWRESNNLEFRRTRGVKKTMRKRLNAAVNLLKQAKWLAPAKVEYDLMERVTFSKTDVMNAIRRHLMDLDRGYNLRDGIVLLGAEQWHEIAHQTPSYPLTFSVQVEMHHQDSPYGPPARTLLNMPVCVLPWIDGVVIVPRDMWPIEVKTVPVVVAMTPEMADDERKRREGLLAADAWNRFMGRTIIEAPCEEGEVWEGDEE